MLKVHTETGSLYEFDGGTVTRKDMTHELRGDGQTLTCWQYTFPEKGKSMRIWLRVPDGTDTVRTTSPVASYEHDGEDL